MHHNRLLAASCLMMASALAQAAFPTTTLRDHPGVTATMEIDSAACPTTLPVTVRSNSNADFDKDNKVLVKVMGWAQIVGSMSCPNATAIRLTGITNGNTIYKGIALRTNNWVLAEIKTDALPVSPQPTSDVAEPASIPGSTTSPATALSSAFETISQCDDLAAHPADPESVATGMSDALIDANSVIAACEVAIKIDKDSPRLRFQLARGYLKADRFEDSVEQLLSAAQEGHGGALAYLGDIYVGGAPGIEADPILARSLYQRAVDSGFSPAQALLDEYEDKTEAFALAEKAEAERAALAELSEKDAGTQTLTANATAANTGFNRPALMAGIYSGNFDSIPNEEIDAKEYLLYIAGNIAGVCGQYFSQSEVETLQERYRAVDTSPTGAQPTLLSTLLAVAQMSQDPFASVNEGLAISREKRGMFDDSMEDSSVLFERYPCGSANMERFSKNIRKYVKNENAPVASESELLETCSSEYQGEPGVNSFELCSCLVSTVRSNVFVTQGERKALSTKFRSTVKTLRGKYPEKFRFCFGA